MDELEFVKKELEKHRGKRNTISAGEIAEMLGYPVEGSHVKGRDLVKRCAKKYRVPVGGNASGYYIITTQEELRITENIRELLKRRNVSNFIFSKNYFCIIA